MAYDDPTRSAPPPRGIFSPVGPTPRTREAAHLAALPQMAGRRGQILRIIQEKGSICIFEAAQLLGIQDNQISGRFSELVGAGLIQPSGQTRLKPGTDCPAVVYILSAAATRPTSHEQLLDRLGYAATISISGDGLADRQPHGQPDLDQAMIPYAQRSDGCGRPVVWLAWVQCPECGRPLRYEVKRVAVNQVVKRFHCDNTACGITLELTVAGEVGGRQCLALIRRTG